jgi:hypothetical protein
MVEDKNGHQFWKERRYLTKSDETDFLITKDPNGKRIYDPEKSKENVALYYENLYKQEEFEPHPYHNETKRRVIMYSHDREHEHLEINQTPGKKCIETAVKNGKNNKATTDIKNEILKGGGSEMIEIITSIVQEFWRSEEVPAQWNEGEITNLWKGKGDREVLSNYRGITVSSSIGMIIEQILNSRILKTIAFSQAQGGGKKGSSTCDHVFLIKAVIAYAKKTKKGMILTFYDVKKAYDKADVDDMMVSLWDQGVKGKIWRLTRALNKNLTARVKTKHGKTRRIYREQGGKQGSKIMGTMFAKMTDTLAEGMLKEEKLGVKFGEMKIPGLLWVDDVVSFAESKQQQQETLEHIDGFAHGHKLKWGVDKCATMEVGCHRDVQKSWKLGKEEIKHSQSYKYLGEIIDRNGKNQENLKEKFKKAKHSTISIITCGQQDVMKKVEVSTTLNLHEKVTVKMILHNSETWVLTKTDEQTIEKIDLWCLKRILNLPRTTPSAAVRFTTGTMYIKVRIDMIQMLYLQKILKREVSNWTRKMLTVLDDLEIGWAEMIRKKLVDYGLNESWKQIEEMSEIEWKKKVKQVAEENNKNLMIEECHKRGKKAEEKTKTKPILEKIQSDMYLRKQDLNLLTLNKLKVKCIIMARYGMLECRNNYRGKYGSKVCNVCKCVDNEEHVINDCSKFEGRNRYGKVEKIAFQDVYSDDRNTLDIIAMKLMEIWEIENGKNNVRSL